MARTLLQELGHLPLDHTRVDPVATRRQTLLTHLLQQTRVPATPRLCLSGWALRQTQTHNTQTTHKRQLFRGDSRMDCRLCHQRPRHVVTQRQSIQLLHYPHRRLAPHLRLLARQAWRLVRLLLVVDQLLLPALVIQKDQLRRRVHRRIQQGSQQRVDLSVSRSLRVVQHVTDHPHHNPLLIPFSVSGAGVNLAQKRAVRQNEEGLELWSPLEPEQQLAAAIGQLLPACVAEKVAVAQQQHVRPQMPPQPRHHGPLTGGAGFENEGQLGVAVQFHQAQLAYLGKSTIAPTTAGTPEEAGVGLRIGHVEHGTVDANQVPPSVTAARLWVRRQRPDHLLPQSPHGGDAQPLPRPAQPRASRQSPSDQPSAGLAKDFPQRQIGQDSRCQDNPEHDLVGQTAMTAVASAQVTQHLLQAVGADKLLESGQSLQLHWPQRWQRGATSLSRHRHSPSDPWCLVTSRYQRAVTYANCKRYWAYAGRSPFCFFSFS